METQATEIQNKRSDEKTKAILHELWPTKLDLQSEYAKFVIVAMLRKFQEAADLSKGGRALWKKEVEMRDLLLEIQSDPSLLNSTRANYLVSHVGAYKVSRLLGIDRYLYQAGNLKKVFEAMGRDNLQQFNESEPFRAHGWGEAASFLVTEATEALNRRGKGMYEKIIEDLEEEGD